MVLAQNTKTSGKDWRPPKGAKKVTGTLFLKKCQNICRKETTLLTNDAGEAGCPRIVE